MEAYPQGHNDPTTELRSIVQGIDQALLSDEISVRLQQRNPWLQVLFEARVIPDRTVCIPLARRAVQQCHLAGVQAIVIYGRRWGQHEPDWTYKYPLREFTPRGTSRVRSPQSSESPQTPAAAPSSQSRSNRLVMRVSALSLLGFSFGGLWGLLDHSQLQGQSRQLGQTVLATISQNLDRLTPSSSPQSPAETNLSEVLPETPEIPTPNLPSSIRIKAVGDMILGTNYPSHRLPADPSLFFANVMKDLQGADILFGNYESTLTDHPNSPKDTSRGTQFAFRSPPSYRYLLQDAGFDIVSLANNHSMDFGEIGLRDTIRNFNDVGIATVGERYQITYLNVEDVTIAFIGFSTYDFHNDINNIELARQLIAEADKQAEVIVLSIHAGAEGTGAMHVSDRQEYFLGEDRGNIVGFSREAIDAGADLILGHGPHIPRAINLYNDRLIAYSLADFVGYQTLSTEGALAYSLILEVELNLEGEFISGQIIPIHLGTTGIPVPDGQFRTVNLIRNLTQTDFPNAPIMIDEQGQLLVK